MTKDIIKTQPSSLSPLVQAAMENKHDPAYLKEMLEVQKEYEANEAKKAFSMAMAECQKEMPMIVRNAENQQTSSKYAKHEMICKLIKPVYTEHGFSLSFHEGESKKEDEIRILCDVDHALGHSKQYYIDLLIDDKGIKGSVNKTGVHAKGSTFSYGRRYLTLMIFDLATYDDNDGNVAPPPELITQEQADTIKQRIKEHDLGLTAFMNWLRADLKCNSIEEINVKAFDLVIKRVNSAIRAQEKKNVNP